MCQGAPVSMKLTQSGSYISICICLCHVQGYPQLVWGVLLGGAQKVREIQSVREGVPSHLSEGVSVRGKNT